MTITKSDFEQKVENFLLNSHFTSLTDLIENGDPREVYLFLSDPDVNEYLCRPVKFIDDKPLLESPFEKELYSNESIKGYIPYRYLTNEFNGFMDGIDNLHYFSSVFSGIYGQSVQTGKSYAEYKNIYFVSQELEITLLLEFAQGIAMDAQKVALWNSIYCIMPLSYGEHYSNLIITIRNPKPDETSVQLECMFINSWEDSEDFESNYISSLRKKTESLTNTTYSSINLGIQTEKFDYDCSVYGLNIAKAVGRIGLNKLPVTQESLVKELPMYYNYDGTKKNYEQIKEYNLKAKWEISSNHLKNILYGHIFFEIFKDYPKEIQEKLSISNNDEISCMKAFIYDDIGYSRGLEEMADAKIEQQITEVKLDDLILSDEKALLGSTESNEEAGSVIQ